MHQIVIARQAEQQQMHLANTNIKPLAMAPAPMRIQDRSQH